MNFPTDPILIPDPQPGDYPAGLTVTEFADDLGGGKQCLGFVAVADLKANPKLRFNAVHLPQQKTPSRIHAEFASANRGTACVTTNAGYWWAGNSLSLLVTGDAVKSIENQTVTRNNQTVYPVRSSFGQMASGGFETHWIYCVLDDGNKPYAFPSALDNDERTNTYMVRAAELQRTPARRSGLRRRRSEAVRCWSGRGRTSPWRTIGKRCSTAAASPGLRVSRVRRSAPQRTAN